MEVLCRLKASTVVILNQEDEQFRLRFKMHKFFDKILCSIIRLSKDNGKKVFHRLIRLEYIFDSSAIHINSKSVRANNESWSVGRNQQAFKNI